MSVQGGEACSGWGQLNLGQSLLPVRTRIGNTRAFLPVVGHLFDN